METPTGESGAQRQKFAAMASRCESILVGLARRLTRGDDDKAQDLVQDSLVRGYEALRRGQYQDSERPCAWLARILSNGFINQYRRTRRWDAGVTVDEITAGGEVGPPQTRADAEDRPDEALLLGALDEPLEKALLSLPEDLRRLVLLVDIQDATYQEAAETFNIPIGTVRSRLSRARFQLSEKLHGWAKERRLV